MTLMHRYPAVSYLRAPAKRRIPHLAWEFLDSGTGSDRCVVRNEAAFEAVRLVPRFLRGDFVPGTKTELFGIKYDAPFGIAPIGQSGLIWPGAEKILAATAAKFRIPYGLSTVAAESIEAVGPIAGDMGWFQLYPPKDTDIRDDILNRAATAGFEVCMLTVDIPIPSRRERQFRAGMSLPPRLTPRIFAQALARPRWCLEVLRAGAPRFRTLDRYMERMADQDDGKKDIATFMARNLGNVLDWDYVAQVRDRWTKPLIIKGILSPADAVKAVELGIDGILVSNHGGRQLDAAPSSLEMLSAIRDAVGGRVKILLDSGIRTGEDVLKARALGADFVLLGRAFQYGVAALGRRGGDHVAEILFDELKNTMSQIGLRDLTDVTREFLRAD